MLYPLSYRRTVNVSGTETPMRGRPGAFLMARIEATSAIINDDAR